jgi:hypothetical protein
MNREIHVRVCEGLRGRFPRSTRRAPRGCTEDEGMAPRSRLAGAGSKTPQAAVVKSHGGER